MLWIVPIIRVELIGGVKNGCIEKRWVIEIASQSSKSGDYMTKRFKYRLEKLPAIVRGREREITHE